MSDLSFHRIRITKDDWYRVVEGDPANVAAHPRREPVPLVLRLRDDRRSKDVSSSRTGQPPWLRDRRVAQSVDKLHAAERRNATSHRALSVLSGKAHRHVHRL